MTHIVFVVMLRKPFQHLFKLVFERKGRRPSEISEDGRLRPTEISVGRHTSTARLVPALVWQIIDHCLACWEDEDLSSSLPLGHGGQYLYAGNGPKSNHSFIDLHCGGLQRGQALVSTSGRRTL